MLNWFIKLNIKWLTGCLCVAVLIALCLLGKTPLMEFHSVKKIEFDSKFDSCWTEKLSLMHLEVKLHDNPWQLDLWPVYFCAESDSKHGILLYSDTEARRYATCEGDTAHLSCGEGLIKVLNANYGRRDNDICSSGRPSNQISNVHCFQPRTQGIMSDRCDGRESCAVPVANTVFSDPCVGTYKYLDVSYFCLHPRRQVTCEGQHNGIRCEKGTIYVHHANYGRRDRSICPHRLATTSDCYSPQTYSMRSRCTGRKTCEFSATNSAFSDPCHGVHKYLEVTYSCV